LCLSRFLRSEPRLQAVKQPKQGAIIIGHGPPEQTASPYLRDGALTMERPNGPTDDGSDRVVVLGLPHECYDGAEAVVVFADKDDGCQQSTQRRPKDEQCNAGADDRYGRGG
jgi:hypothetical protein